MRGQERRSTLPDAATAHHAARPQGSIVAAWVCSNIGGFAVLKP
jgi:hypothetical protein